MHTLRRTLHRAGYSWKRMRRSQKAQRDPVTFAACQQQLTALQQAEQRGELALYYADEVRFSRQAHPWQRRGQPLVRLPAERGAGGQLFGTGPVAAGQPAGLWPL